MSRPIEILIIRRIFKMWHARERRAYYQLHLRRRKLRTLKRAVLARVLTASYIDRGFLLPTQFEALVQVEVALMAVEQAMFAGPAINCNFQEDILDKPLHCAILYSVGQPAD